MAYRGKHDHAALYNVADDTTIGHVTMTNNGLEYDNEHVKELMAPRVARLGEAKAFALANGYSNGYLASQEVDDAGAHTG